MFYYVYVLRSLKDGKIYAGYTKDLRKRLLLHNSGEIQATRYRKPLELIYYEAYKNQQDATEREKYFKSNKGKKMIKVILKEYFSS